MNRIQTIGKVHSGSGNTWFRTVISRIIGTKKLGRRMRRLKELFSVASKTFYNFPPLAFSSRSAFCKVDIKSPDCLLFFPWEKQYLSIY
jgi:hypothetical protein